MIGATSTVHRPGENRVLALLPAAERQRILARCDRLAMPAQRGLFKAYRAIEHVYFPLSGMASMVLSCQTGATVEVAAVGNEGMVGMPVYFGAKSSPMEGVWQVSGNTLRMTSRSFRRELQAGGELGLVLQRFSQALMNQISQSVLCNRQHSMDQRLSRWLLMTHDRAGVDEFGVTQQYIAQMLAVRRASVTVAAGMLQKAGLIRCRRGNLAVVDRRRLEARSCECYEVIRRELERLLRSR